MRASFLMSLEGGEVARSEREEVAPELADELQEEQRHVFFSFCYTP